ESIVPALTARQSWTPAAIQEDMVVQFDPASGTVSGIDQLQRGFVKRDEIAWIGTHRHSPEGNQAYVASYAFAYALDLPAGPRARGRVGAVLPGQQPPASHTEPRRPVPSMLPTSPSPLRPSGSGALVPHPPRGSPIGPCHRLPLLRAHWPRQSAAAPAMPA